MKVHQFRKINNKGFSHVETFLFVIVIALIVGIGGYVYTKHKSPAHAGSLCKGQTFQVGSTGTCVKDLQTLSVAFTGINIPINGAFNSTTKFNIIAFQKKAFPSNKTSWDGAVRLNTWSKLCSLVPLSKTQAVYDAQKAACGNTSFIVPTVKPTRTTYGFSNPTSIHADKNGNIWIGNRNFNNDWYAGTVVEFDSKGNFIYDYSIKEPTKITSDQNGNIWVSSMNTNITFEILDVNNSVYHGYINEYPSNQAFDIITDLNGNIWSLDLFGNITKFDSKKSFKSINYEIPGSSKTGFGQKITSDQNGNIWVTDSKYNSVIEMNSQGNLVKVYSDPSYGFNKPHSITSDQNGNIWVTNYNNNSVTEINSQGNLVKVYSDPSYGFNRPSDITSDQNGNIWVTNSNNNSVTEMNSQGNLVKVYSDPSYGFNNPHAITSDKNGNIWIVNSKTVTELNASTGSLVRIIK